MNNLIKFSILTAVFTIAMFSTSCKKEKETVIAVNGVTVALPAGISNTLTVGDTYTGMLNWLFGSTNASPWKMVGDAYPLPVLYWQTAASAANLDHLK